MNADTTTPPKFSNDPTGEQTEQAEVRTSLVRRRFAQAIALTEDPITFKPTPMPHVRRKDLPAGVRLIRVEADYYRGVWVVILDVTDSENASAAPLWAPGLPMVVIVSQESVDAVQQAQESTRSRILVPTAAPLNPEQQHVLAGLRKEVR